MRPADSRTLRFRRRLAVLTFPVALVAAEIGLRVAGYERESLVLPGDLAEERMLAVPSDGPSTHRFDAATLWAPRPGAVITPDVVPTINAAGYRGLELAGERTPGSLRVALLGESVLFGYGVTSEESVDALLPPLLQGAAPVVEVFNASMIGASIAQGLQRYRTLVRPLHPDVVCVAFGNHNEAVPARGPPDVERLAAARASTEGWGGAWRALGRRLRVLQALQHLGTLATGRADGTASFAGGGLAETEDLRLYGALDWPGTRRVPVAQFRHLLDVLLGEIAADGTRPVLCLLAMHPDQAPRYPIMSRYADVLEETARERGVPLVDLRAALQQAGTDGAGSDALFLPNDPWHYGPQGQALLARELAVGVLR